MTAETLPSVSRDYKHNMLFFYAAGKHLAAGASAISQKICFLIDSAGAKLLSARLACFVPARLPRGIGSDLAETAESLSCMWRDAHD